MIDFGGSAEEIQRYYILWFRELLESNLRYDRNNEGKRV